MSEPVRVASGVSELDRLLGGLFIGDNVVWLDDAGSLATVFCGNFIMASQSQERPLIYVTFDRSPKNLLDKLGPLADYPALTILDCFTHGKGMGSEVFLKFYEDPPARRAANVVLMSAPGDPEEVSQALYGLQARHQGDVRFVLESITGMQELWGDEEAIVNFYSRTCPRLYELNTIAYWIMEKAAHSDRLKAQIAHIAQVVIELSIKRGTTNLMVVKAEKRPSENLHRQFNYWSKGASVSFDPQRRAASRFDLGKRIKELRGKKGLSQTDLAKMVGVTPSTISQVESNHIYPSLPALIKMAEVLSVEIASFFNDGAEDRQRVVFSAEEAVEVKLVDMPAGAVRAQLLSPVDLDSKTEPYIIEIPPKTSLPSHFFMHKGEEVGYVLAGRVQLKIKKAVHNARAGDVIFLTNELPTNWQNPGRTPARLLWLKIG
ncbi:transcriptional regulator, XRE family [Desulfarculus baarsii DSM 2075]|uniref:Transcriptional regulator, XRE family n=1 Tax=Desulfarculus baarsii (strain ATCC 33931 / DSM 2075 / LMG 7858 / VKM B-1802 / 2st14) TaxID=644282 RepID=E1QES7_DESB2|nr:helix-turn-helix domain-containing protein [Desulfarculus baarsii]ADK84063.1 transcriptional regulator, XRE family [Desulfarculus baarsii DSM 2075]